MALLNEVGDVQIKICGWYFRVGSPANTVVVQKAPSLLAFQTVCERALRM